MALSGNLASEQRLEWIRSHLDTGKVVRIKAAADELDVSEMTIRRDLVELEAMGQARRVRGGAVAAGPVAFEDRHRRQARAKARIAAKALALVPEVGAIGIDASSTMLRLATGLAGARELTVITNGRDTFDALQRKPGIRPLLTGGEMDRRTGSLVGPMALRAAGTFALSHLFTSCAAIDTDLGCTEAALEEAEVKQAMARVADHVVVAVDATKLDTRSVARGFDWDDVDTLITDLSPESAKLAEYRPLARLI